MTLAMPPDQLLRWYIEAGVDEAIGEQPLDRYALAKTTAAAPRAETARQPRRDAPAAAMPPRPTSAAMPPAPPPRATTAHLAMECKTLAALKATMEAFDGCALKQSCRSTVFADGNPEASVMLIGEAPGADEDRIGLPFVGASGKLLDRMLASIGLDRGSAYITNVVPWRPPGNRTPTPGEIELCLPFIQRHIELVDPQIVVLLGGAPAHALLARNDAMYRLRGRWIDYASSGLSRPIPAIATYHPAYLLRTPAHKRETWLDLLAIRKRLDGRT